MLLIGIQDFVDNLLRFYRFDPVEWGGVRGNLGYWVQLERCASVPVLPTYWYEPNQTSDDLHQQREEMKATL